MLLDFFYGDISWIGCMLGFSLHTLWRYFLFKKLIVSQMLCLSAMTQSGKKEIFSNLSAHHTVGNTFWWHWKCKIIVQGRQLKHVCTLAIAMPYGGIVSPRARNYYSRYLPAHSRDGRDCRLVHMMAGAIKSVEGSLPEKYQSGQHYQGTALGVRNPTVRFSSDFSA